jgi:hypothetical protein
VTLSNQDSGLTDLMLFRLRIVENIVLRLEFINVMMRRPTKKDPTT